MTARQSKLRKPLEIGLYERLRKISRYLVVGELNLKSQAKRYTEFKIQDPTLNLSRIGQRTRTALDS
jgi:hypothetical protein